MKVLLDSETVIDAIRGRLPVVLRLAALKPAEVHVSVLSRIEAECALRRMGAVQARFAKLLQLFFGSVKVLDLTGKEAEQAIKLAPYLLPQSSPLSHTQLLLAATAIAHQLTLITPNPQHYAPIPGLSVEHWN